MVLKKRLTSLIKRPSASEDKNLDSDADTPEANAARGVRLFCESGAANTGEEVLHLPTIVEAAVASPAAAASAATQIRKFLSKENYSRPHVQYNAVMVIRILTDNPGQSFTKNLDKGFSDTVKQLLRNGQDPSVAQILRETLDALDREKAYDTNLNTLFVMWRKERTLMANAAKQFGPRTMNAPAWNGQRQQPQGRFMGNGPIDKGLPPPIELVSRIEEARTSAKLLLQLVQSTPSHELLGNDLVKEFSERCMSAQRSIQNYINCDNPPPDDDTMLTLIETNEQLSLAASKHQRAVLQARRIQGPSPSPQVSQVNSNNPSPPSGPASVPTPAPTNSYNPSPVSSYTPAPPPRNQAPVLPPLDVGSRDQNFNQNRSSPATSYKNDVPLAPSLQTGPGHQRTSTSTFQEEDRYKDSDINPFADHYSSTYPTAPGQGHSVPQRFSTSTYSDDSPAVGYGRGNVGSPDSYNPGYKPTSSYLGRQESSSNNLTMHGASQPSHLSGEEEYARDYPVNGRPKTPEEARRVTQDSDVSPIADRGALTYRY
ncbi:hypothetical protein K504DRAFT_457747 [Pleomassaria siparia CBS 279.74]|uniref:GAT domain-containing protein n=1 Tax=Pleomassaria siparia CBS 279.74 TaxID=1314801 RepID=A0A6G1KRW2_9PLEO|nr:hypothetical protein K504DRAFT_457747 [Pleomassaria siparia CBS 279.74]